jgi:hypothetical protein
MRHNLADFRPDSADRNIEKDPNNEHRCELCWKPLKEGNEASVGFTDMDNLTLPKSDDDLIAGYAPLGSDCLKKLKRFAKKDGFVVKTKESAS